MGSLIPLEIPLAPTPDQARQWLSDELSGSEYAVRRDYLRDFLRWLFENLNGDGTSGGRGMLGSWVIVALIAVALFFLIRWILRMRTDSTSSAAKQALHSSLVEAGVSADEYRSRALAALTSGDCDLATVEAYRAIIVDLDSRHVMGDSPARTAQEAARAASTVFPQLGAELSGAASLFDLALYGLSRPPRVTPADAQHVLDLSNHLAQTWPLSTPATTGAPVATPAGTVLR